MTAARMDALEERSDRLEQNLAQLTANVARVSANLDRLSREAREEMREHRREVEQELREHRREVQQELRDYREERRKRDEAWTEELRKHREEQDRRDEAWTEELRTHREEQNRRDEAWTEELRKDREELRKHREQSWRETVALRQSIAEVSHKMGTMAEDLVAPSVPRILKQVLRCDDEPVMLGVRIRKRLPDGRSQEYDVIAVANHYLLVNETKNRMRPEDVAAFVQTLAAVREFLPEYADKKIIGALASFYVDPSLVVHGTRQGIIMLGVTDGMMDLLNGEDFVPKEY